MKGKVYIYTGDGRGKSPAAIGRAVQEATIGKTVVIIQFLKGKVPENIVFLKKMEPEIKLFRFEKSGENYSELTQEKQKEECRNILNGINFARKVLTTGECDLLVLDEVLGLIANGIITVDELKRLLEVRDETNVIMTGVELTEEISRLADEISRIETVTNSGV